MTSQTIIKESCATPAGTVGVLRTTSAKKVGTRRVRFEESLADFPERIGNFSPRFAVSTRTRPVRNRIPVITTAIRSLGQSPTSKIFECSAVRILVFYYIIGFCY
jgi:hypothetical protein